MKYLLPNYFKKIGVIIAPTGFFLWICMQFGYITKALIFLFGEISETNQSYHYVNVLIAIVSFFSFLFGTYFIAFSKEKIEDELVQKIRLESFQFAALLQIILIIIGFSFMAFTDPSEAGLLFFFINLIMFFWICFILRFNYILHIKILSSKKS